MDDVIDEVFAQPRKNFQRRKYTVTGLNDLFQADLLVFDQYEKENDGFKYLLCIINCFSKKLYAQPLMNKTCKETADKSRIIFKQIISDLKTGFNHISTDRGREFEGKQFQELCQEFGVKHYVIFSEKKAVFVERVQKTILLRLHKMMAKKITRRWIDLIQGVVENYNNSTHSTIKMPPNDVTKDDEKRLLKLAFHHPKVYHRPKFSVGQHVRISMLRNPFHKSYLQNYSHEIYTIHKVRVTYPNTYILKDYNGHIISGSFYTEQLKAVKDPDIYLIDKVLKRRGNKMLVKYSGFTEPGWINANQLIA